RGDPSKPKQPRPTSRARDFYPMVDDAFGFARVVSSDEAADYLSSLAQNLSHGDVRLDSGGRVLHLVPPAELKLDLRVKHSEGKSELLVRLAWKRQALATIADLHVESGPSSPTP